MAENENKTLGDTGSSGQVNVQQASAAPEEAARAGLSHVETDSLLDDVADYGEPTEWSLGTYGKRSRKDMTDETFKKLETGETITMQDYVKANLALEDAKMEAGIVDDTPPKGVFALFARYTDWKENRTRHKVNKKKYLLLCILLGWMGGHRYYEKRNTVAVLYTLFFWTAIPLFFCLTDLLIAIPMPADENGDIMI